MQCVIKEFALQFTPETSFRTAFFICAKILNNVGFCALTAEEIMSIYYEKENAVVPKQIFAEIVTLLIEHSLVNFTENDCIIRTDYIIANEYNIDFIKRNIFTMGVIGLGFTHGRLGFEEETNENMLALAALGKFDELTGLTVLNFYTLIKTAKYACVTKNNELVVFLVENYGKLLGINLWYELFQKYDFAWQLLAKNDAFIDKCIEGDDSIFKISNLHPLRKEFGVVLAQYKGNFELAQEVFINK